jgi:hypothetical protein
VVVVVVVVERVVPVAFFLGVKMHGRRVVTNVFEAIQTNGFGFFLVGERGGGITVRLLAGDEDGLDSYVFVLSKAEASPRVGESEIVRDKSMGARGDR